MECSSLVLPDHDGVILAPISHTVPDVNIDDMCVSLYATFFPFDQINIKKISSGKPISPFE